MKSGASGLLGFLLGVAITALVASLLMDGGNNPSSEKRTTDSAAEREALPQAHDAEPGRAARPIEVAATDAAAVPPSPSRADDRIGILVYGTVSDPSGAPVSSEWMSLQFAPETQASRNVTITPDGTYAATGLVPGACRVSANLLSYRPWRADLELRADEPAVRLDVVLEPSDVLIIKAFTRDGRPLLDALKAEMPERTMWDLRVSALASLEPIASLPSELGRGWDSYGIGYYRDKYEAVGPLRDRGQGIPADAMGLLELDVPLPVFVTLAVRQAILTSQRVEPGQKDVVFTVDVADVTATFGSLVARMVDAGTRAPLAGVQIEVNDAQSSGVRQPTGADGVLRLEGVRAGRMRFQATLDGYERLNALVHIPPASHVDIGDVPLARSRTLNATVLDAQDRPVSARVSLQNLDPPQGLSWDGDYQGWLSEQDGHLKIEGLGQHRYSVMLRDKTWASQPLIVDTTLGDVSGVVLRAVPSVSISLRLEWPQTVTHGLRVTASSGHVATNWSGWQGGNVWSGNLAAGDYLAEIYDGATVLLSRNFKLGTAPVILTLAP